MAGTSQQEIKLFYCYAREDKPLRDELEKHLAWLRRRYRLTNWHDREILPGEEWEQAIDTHLNTANLILLLISPDFMASDYCYGKEMRRALKRHQAGTCRVVPILLRPTYWKGAPFSHLQLLPTDARPITRWPDRDEAFQDVVAEINRAIEDLLNSPKTKEEWVKEGNALYNLKRYEEALVTFEQAIRLDSKYAPAHYGMGIALEHFKRYEEALVAFEQAIRLDSKYAPAHYGKGIILERLKQDQEALEKMQPTQAPLRGTKVDKVTILTQAYEDVRSGRITDPVTIRLIASRFEAIANDPIEQQSVEFDAAKVAGTLYERAALHEKQFATGDN
jgi:tetratricopeptide (TPR) repeat protein